MSEHTDEVTLVCYDEDGDKVGELTMTPLDVWVRGLPFGTTHVKVKAVEQIRLEP